MVNREAYGDCLRFFRNLLDVRLMFEWLKKILGMQKNPPSSKPDDEGGQNPISIYDELDERKQNAKDEKECLTQSSTDWYAIEVQQESNRKTPIIFLIRKLEELPTLQSLKIERLKKEAHELKLLKEEITTLLTTAENTIAQGKVKEAKESLSVVRNKIVRIKDADIRKHYIQAQEALIKLENTLEQKRLARLKEEQERKEEEKRKKKTEEERIIREQKRQAEELRKKRQEEVDRCAAEARKKEQAEQAERQRLEKLSDEKKDNWEVFYQVLVSNGIRYLYHFTDKRNIPSIKRHGGLFSWHYCKNNNINIPCQGGDYDSRELDKKYGLQDYVRLSFCDDHPMAYRLQQSGSDIKILRIKIDVALLKGTLFSDINAADKLHTHGGSLQDLKRVDFGATKRHYVKKNDEDFKTHQAEVMVKTFVPLKYIENI